MSLSHPVREFLNYSHSSSFLRQFVLVWHMLSWFKTVSLDPLNNFVVLHLQFGQQLFDLFQNLWDLSCCFRNPHNDSADVKTSFTAETYLIGIHGKRVDAFLIAIYLLRNESFFHLLSPSFCIPRIYLYELCKSLMSCHVQSVIYLNGKIKTFLNVSLCAVTSGSCN